jgi:MFS family permease
MRAGPVAIITPLFLAEVTVVFEAVMVYAALPTLIRTFGDPIMAGWLLTSHMLLATASIPVAGRLGDIMGRKKTMLLLIAIATAGSTLSALSDDFLLVLIGRGLQGLSAAVLPLAIGVMRESLRKEQVPLGVGLLTTAQGVGTAAGLVLGGVIVDRFDWHWLFVASAMLLLLSFVAVALMVPAKAGTPPR